MSNNEIIFVTAFKDINRDKWMTYNVSNGRYVDYFYDLAKTIKYKLVVYVENDIKEFIMNRFNKKFNDNIIFKELTSVNTFFDKFIQKDKIIINSDIYQNKIPDYRKKNPEHIYSEYNLINHSKINFVKHTKNLFPNYLFYAWIDFGRMNERLDNIPKNIDISLLPNNKITYHCVNEPPVDKIDENEMLKSHAVYFLGSSFIVPRDLIESFESLWENKIINWHERWITDDDQNLVLQLYYDTPYLFNKITYADWYGMYRKLIKE